MRVVVWLAAVAVFALLPSSLAESPPAPPVATYDDLLPNVGCLVGFSDDTKRMIVAMDSLKEVCFAAPLGGGKTYYGKTAVTDAIISNKTGKYEKHCEKTGGSGVCYCSNNVIGGLYTHSQCSAAYSYCPKYCNVPETSAGFEDLQTLGIYTVDGCATDSVIPDQSSQECFDVTVFNNRSSPTGSAVLFAELKDKLLNLKYKVVRFDDGVCPLVLGWKPAAADSTGDTINAEYSMLQAMDVSCSKKDGACFSKFDGDKLFAGCKPRLEPPQPADLPKNDTHCYIDKRDRKFAIGRLAPTTTTTTVADDCECPVTTNATTSCLIMAPALKPMTNKIIPTPTATSKLCRVGYQDPNSAPTTLDPAMLATYNPSKKICRAVRADSSDKMYFGIEDKCPAKMDSGVGCESDFRNNKLEDGGAGTVHACQFPTTTIDDCYCNNDKCNTPALTLDYTQSDYDNHVKQGNLGANAYVDRAEGSAVYLKDESNVTTECYNVAAMRMKDVGLHLNSKIAMEMPTVKCDFTMEECFAVFHKKSGVVESFISLGCRPQKKDSNGVLIPNQAPFASGKIPHPIEFKQAGELENPSHLPNTLDYSCTSDKCNMDFSNTRIHDGAVFWCHDDIVAKGSDPRRVLLCDSCGVDRRDMKFDFYYCIVEHKKSTANDQSREDSWTKNSVDVDSTARDCKDLTAKKFCICPSHFCTVGTPKGRDERPITSSKPAKSHLNEYTDGHVCFAAGAWAPNVAYSNNTANFIPCHKDERCYLTYAFYDASMEQHLSKGLKMSIETFAGYSGNAGYDKNGNTKVYFKMGCASRLAKGGNQFERADAQRNELDAADGAGAFTKDGHCPAYAFIPADTYTWHSKPNDESRKPQSGTCFCQPTKYNATDETFKPCNFPDEQYFNAYFTTLYPPTLPDFKDTFTARSGGGASKSPQLKFPMPTNDQTALFTVATFITTLIVALLM